MEQDITEIIARRRASRMFPGVCRDCPIVIVLTEPTGLTCPFDMRLREEGDEAQCCEIEATKENLRRLWAMSGVE